MQLTEEWPVCLSHECPDNPPFEGEPVLMHCHPLSVFQEKGWDYRL